LEPSRKDLQPAEYRALATFRYQIRRFLHFSEQAAARAGLEARQHQLLLSLKALRYEGTVTIRDLAEHLQRRHHTVVGLVDRLEEHGVVERLRSQEDKREVCVELTTKGEELLRQLSLDHRAELQAAGPALVRALNALMRDGGVH
jgi:DNA-binding MarR family transcriptional regulator